LSLEQINFKDSLTLSILTITNTVNSNNYNLGEFYFLEYKYNFKNFLNVFMIIGRVELLGFLILIKKFFLNNQLLNKRFQIFIYCLFKFLFLTQKAFIVIFDVRIEGSEKKNIKNLKPSQKKLQKKD
jgi:hypothetical protein